MSEVDRNPIDRFALAAGAFCAWARSETSSENDLPQVCQFLADLVAAGCALGWSPGEPSKLLLEASDLQQVKERTASLPFQYYSEVYNPLVVPAEEPVVGDLTDDLLDIFRDIAPGLALYQDGKREEAASHWRFWFAHHWGEHATSALRAAWAFLAGRGSSSR